MVRLLAHFPLRRSAWPRESPTGTRTRDDLARAEERYGVPAEIVVAIIGVETFYGEITGNFRVLDALTTLAFDYPRRSGILSRRAEAVPACSRASSGMPPEAAKGSFAGAMGVPQFMPGSYRTYAVDSDGSGRPDLWKSAADIAGSVANYLARHDWQPGQADTASGSHRRRQSATRSCASSMAASRSAARPNCGRPMA